MQRRSGAEPGFVFRGWVVVVVFCAGASRRRRRKFSFKAAGHIELEGVSMSRWHPHAAAKGR